MRNGQRIANAARIRVGDRVLLEGRDTAVEVVSIDDPALLTVRTKRGAEFKAGRLTVLRVLKADDAA